MNSKPFAIFLASLVFLTSPANAADETVETPSSLSRKIEEHLQPGDNKTEIEEFMNNQGWLYTFDQFSIRYQARTKDGLSYCNQFQRLFPFISNCKVSIYIEVDDQLRYTGFDVVEVNTGL